MATGSPLFRARYGAEHEAGHWGVQPSGPFLSILPSPQTVDYVHKLTQTILLLAGFAVFVYVHRHRQGEGLRKLQGRVT